MIGKRLNYWCASEWKRVLVALVRVVNRTGKGGELATIENNLADYQRVTI